MDDFLSWHLLYLQAIKLFNVNSVLAWLFSVAVSCVLGRRFRGQKGSWISKCRLIFRLLYLLRVYISWGKNEVEPQR
jgi:hypothetical protein